jgi:hypothetical protein
MGDQSDAYTDEGMLPDMDGMQKITDQPPDAQPGDAFEEALAELDPMVDGEPILSRKHMQEIIARLRAARYPIGCYSQEDVREYGRRCVKRGYWRATAGFTPEDSFIKIAQHEPILPGDSPGPPPVFASEQAKHDAEREKGKP